MTREQMAELVTRQAYMGDACIDSGEGEEIAAELRKTCATCIHFHPVCNSLRPVRFICLAKGMYHGQQPADGSGFCHRWEGKP